MTTRQVLMGLVLLAAAWLAFFGDKTPPAGIAQPTARVAAPIAPAVAPLVSAGTSARSAKAEREPVILALQARDVLIGGAHGAAQTPGLFASQTWMPPPPPPPKPLPPPPPTAPPLPFAYLGKKSEDSRWEVYLARGEQTLIVREQSVIDGTYRIESIRPPLISFIFLPLNQTQTLTIGGVD